MVLCTLHGSQSQSQSQKMMKIADQVHKMSDFIEIQIKGKVNKGIAGYMNIMTKDTRMQALRGKIVTLRVIAVEEEQPKSA